MLLSKQFQYVPSVGTRYLFHRWNLTAACLNNKLCLFKPPPPPQYKKGHASPLKPNSLSTDFNLIRPSS